MEQSKMMECINKGFEAYELFVNQEIHYIYKKERLYEEVVFKATTKDFMHLCGVFYLDPKTKKEVTAKHFYSLVKSNKISPSFLGEKKDGTTKLKLQVISNLKDLLTPKIRVLDGQMAFHNFSFEKGLRSGRQIFALGLGEQKPNSEIYFPLSLLNLQTDKSHALKTSYEVHRIYAVSRGEENHVYYESEEYSTVPIQVHKMQKTSAL